MDPVEQWRSQLGEALEEIARMHMPFGKYGPQHYPPLGMPLYDLPAGYLMWFRQKGFPPGKLGRLMSVVCEIHLAGAEAVFEPLRQRAGGRRPIRKPPRRRIDFPDSGSESAPF